MADLKCTICKVVFDEAHLEDGSKCPQCHRSDGLVKACPNDHPECDHEISSSVVMCPVCGHEMCPQCGCHDVIGISRVTGYQGPTASWNAGKRQELADRTHYNL